MAGAMGRPGLMLLQIADETSLWRYGRGRATICWEPRAPAPGFVPNYSGLSPRAVLEMDQMLHTEHLLLSHPPPVLDAAAKHEQDLRRMAFNLAEWQNGAMPWATYALYVAAQRTGIAENFPQFGIHDIDDIMVLSWDLMQKFYEVRN